MKEESIYHFFNIRSFERISVKSDKEISAQIFFTKIYVRINCIDLNFTL